MKGTGLNHERYGAQFNAFVDFASTQRNPGWIACKDSFMSFYSAKLDGFAENGGPSKKDFDNVLSTLFNRTKGIMRKTTANS